MSESTTATSRNCIEAGLPLVLANLIRRGNLSLKEAETTLDAVFRSIPGAPVVNRTQIIDDAFALAESGELDESEKKPENKLPDLESAADLQMVEIEPVRAIIEAFRPEGLSIIAARPKQGKSWLELSRAINIASGQPVLGKYKTIRGKVLYLALEDSRRRMQSRMRTLLGDDALWPPDLTFAYEWRRLDKGGIDDLRAWLKENSDASEIVIDTFTRIKPPKRSGADSYQHDAEVTAALQRLAVDYQVSVVLIMHTRKAESSDPFDLVSGTLGTNASADAIEVLVKKPATGTTVLHFTSRDFEAKTLELNFENGLWSLLGDAVDPATEQDCIAEFLVEILKDGPVQSESVIEKAKMAGYSRNKIFDAKKAAGVKAKKRGFNDGWEWYLPI